MPQPARSPEPIAIVERLRVLHAGGSLIERTWL
jgi:hypothetical protein